jgi:phage terminase large subunit-like protein
LTPEELEHLEYDWQFWARPEQTAPDWKWHTWLYLAGRGAGKTRTAAEWVRANVCGPTPLAAGKYSRIALVGETAADCRDVLVEGESGLKAIHPKAFRPVYMPSLRRVTWPNGAVATLYNATEPDQLRGPQHDAAWCDELAKWRYAQETWDMLQFGLRLGDNPRQVITTTPRPIPILRDLIKRDGQDVAVTRGSTYANAANLADQFIEQLKARYEGTRLGRQELNAEILDDVPGSLWSRAKIDETRRKVSEKLPDMQRIVVAIDPAAKSNETPEDGAETGIVAAGVGVDGRGYVFDDGSCRLSPVGWARRAIALYDRYSADAVVVEVNQGGDMVKAVLAAERPSLSVIEVHASRGKVTRAEPIAALYEQGRISHIGTHAELEDQMVLFTANGIIGETTGDRVDALVWAFTELFPSIVNRTDVNWADAFAPNKFTPQHQGGWLRG